MQHAAAADEGVRDIGRCRRRLMLSAAAAAAAVFVCGFWHVDTGMRRLWQRLTESVASVGAAPAFFFYRSLSICLLHKVTQSVFVSLYSCMCAYACVCACVSMCQASATSTCGMQRVLLRCGRF